MASFLVRIFREQSDYLAVVDGWGTVRSPTLRGVREEAKHLVRQVVDGAFPPRTCVEQAEGLNELRERLEEGGAVLGVIWRYRVAFPPRRSRGSRRRS